jgi:hypothetical protein
VRQKRLVTSFCRTVLCSTVFCSAALCLIVLLGPVILATIPFQSDDEVRDVVRIKRAASLSDTVNGPAGPSGKKPPSGAAPPRRRKPRAPKDSPGSSYEDCLLGITIWRLRPSVATDAVEIRDIEHPSDGGPAREWTAERMEPDAPFQEGQLLRLTIESFRKGYLYVINRPKYHDGEYGDPHLIFPTQRLRGGDNSVEVGRMIQLPGKDDKPSYFVLSRGKRSDRELQASEELTIILAPWPIEGITTRPSDLNAIESQRKELVANYEAPVQRLEATPASGEPITIAELSASRDRLKRLGENDPYPQTIYRVKIRPQDPMIVRIYLKVE